jgi:hypothetical protein
MQVIGLEVRGGLGTNSPTKLVDRLGVTDSRGLDGLQLGNMTVVAKRVK